MESTMPQNNPMSASPMVRVAQCPICHSNIYGLSHHILGVEKYAEIEKEELKRISELEKDGYLILDIENATVNACECYTPKGYAQLVRSTLEAAADQFCKICPGPGCPGQCKVSDKTECGYWQIIAQKGKI